MSHISLIGRRVVVTGASSGIGRAAAVEFVRRGARVVAAARRAEQLEALALECRLLGGECKTVVADVNSPDDCRRVIETAGIVDVLVNNAGFAIFDSIEEAAADDLEGMMTTNYFGAVHCTQAVLPQMLRRGNGTIVNVASICGLMGFARMGGYCATKFALIGFSEALRDEVVDRGVRVALVCPGTVETEFFIKAERGKMPAANRLILAIPPERVAVAIAKSAEDGRFRRVLPLGASIFMKLNEISPRMAHFLMRRASRALE